MSIGKDHNLGVYVLRTFVRILNEQQGSQRFVPTPDPLSFPEPGRTNEK